ncbi:DedA family protein [Actinokineospora cianjurensis]|uniref:Membrane-associated protein n=1 Tax=Actinokineospora cianjurensis TaxID=585224 RepID=A0A421BCC9_9PSEU|nr:DedA family protein [Actinokineospora cianjurensis]RLK61993.1 membrane-associated protein [Actinokineospora cianjurensis]
MSVLDPHSLLSGFGALGVFLVMFAETGLLIGFFLPGDSLLFTAGVLAATPASTSLHLPLPLTIAAAAAGALLGAQTGYVIGRRGGTALLERSRNRHLHSGVAHSKRVLESYGHRKAIVLARFIPVVRTVLNPLAGLTGVPAGVFALWQVLGGLLWTVGVTVAGYLLGSAIPNVDAYLLPIIAVIVVVSVLPIAARLIRSRSRA